MKELLLYTHHKASTLLLFLPLIIFFTEVLGVENYGSFVSIHGDNQTPGNDPSVTPDPSLNPWEWVELPPVVQDPVTDCDFLSADDGWATTLGNYLLHWDGQSWSEVHPLDMVDEIYPLYAIDMLTSDNGWAVGEFGLMLGWNGQDWKRIPPFAVTNNDLFDVSLLSPELGFASGGRGPLGNKEEDWVVLRWNGLNWLSAPFPRAKGRLAVNLVRIITPQEGWAAAYNTLYRWNGQTWDEHIDSESNDLFNTLYDMSVISPADIWAVGVNAAYFTGERGVIIHWNGQAWEKVATSKYELTNIRMFASDVGWAIGRLEDQQDARNVNGVLLSWDGMRWTEFPLSKKITSGYICGLDTEHTWIFGGEQVFTGPYSSEFVPVYFRLMKKPAPIVTVTLTQTPMVSQTSTPSVFPSMTISKDDMQITEIPVEQGGESLGEILVYGGLILLLLMSGIFLILKLKK